VHALALDAAPDAAQLALGGRVEFGRGVDAARAEPGIHVRPDAEKILQLQPEQALGDVGLVQDYEAVGLLHVRGHLRQQPVGGEADGAGQARAHAPGHGGLDISGDGQGFFPRGEGGGELALHLVDRADVADMEARLDRVEEAVVGVDVEPRAGLDEFDLGAEPPGIGHAHLGFDAPGLRLVAGGDETGRVGEDRDDADRFPAQPGGRLLLARGEKRVEIDGEGAERHGRRTVAQRGARPASFTGKRPSGIRRTVECDGGQVRACRKRRGATAHTEARIPFPVRSGNIRSLPGLLFSP
jgi:hypothetical protein